MMVPHSGCPFDFTCTLALYAVFHLIRILFKRSFTYQSRPGTLGYYTKRKLHSKFHSGDPAGCEDIAISGKGTEELLDDG